MQYSKAEMMAQQLVLAFLGFYSGAIDGIWSTATIKAMQAFECDDKFLPAVPTTGYPFANRSRLPKGMYWDKNLVAHVKLTPEMAADLLAKRAPYTPPAPVSAPVVEAVVETVVEEPVVETPAPVETLVEAPKTQAQPQQQNRNDRHNRR